jgi:hypothetical protein
MNHYWECCGIMYPLTVYRCSKCGKYTHWKQGAKA